MPEKDMLAKRLKAYRHIQHITQFELSAAAGISEEEVSLLERARTDPKLSTLQNLAAYMDVTVSELLRVDHQ